MLHASVAFLALASLAGSGLVQVLFLLLDVLVGFWRCSGSDDAGAGRDGRQALHVFRAFHRLASEAEDGVLFENGLSQLTQEGSLIA